MSDYVGNDGLICSSIIDLLADDERCKRVKCQTNPNRLMPAYLLRQKPELQPQLPSCQPCSPDA